MPQTLYPNAKNSATPSVKVFTFSQFRIEVDGEPLRFGQKAQRKPMQLLKLLMALGGTSVAVETVADSLWPDIDGDKVQGAFSITLHRLRKLIRYESLTLANARLTLDPKICWVDCWAFTELVDIAVRAMRDGDHDAAWGYAEEAFALYRGPFLGGEFELPEILSARAKLHGLFLRHIEQLGEFFLQAGQPQKAITLYQNGLEVDELAEQLYQQLMRCYQQLGRYTEGISVYQDLRETFRAYGGIEPSSETDAIHQELNSEKGKPVDKDTTPNSKVEEKAPDSALPFLEKPSIAVLPFDNLSADPSQEFFADGLVEEILTSLSKISSMTVIARNSTFAYRGKAVDVRQVAQELGVRYVLEGAVRQSGSRLRITAQLIDAIDGSHVWAERYDREFQDIFEVQDEITQHIVEALDVGLLDGEQARVWRQSTQNPEAYDYFLQGRHLWQSTRTRQGMIQARLLFEQAVALDGNFAHALAILAVMYVQEAKYGWSQSPQASLSQGFELVNRAIAVDDSLAYAWGILAMCHLENKEPDQALRDAERSVSLNPDGAEVNTYLAIAQFYVGKPQQALTTSRKAAANTPNPTPRQLITFGLHCLWSGSLEDAGTALKKALERTPDWLDVHVILAAVHAAQGQEAQREEQEILRIEPDFNLKEWVHRLFPFKHEEDSERMMELLRKAGLPE